MGLKTSSNSCGMSFKHLERKRGKSGHYCRGQLAQRMKQNAELMRMMSDQMGMVMSLSERGGVRTPAASVEGSVRSGDPGGPMSGIVPGRQDPDGASSRGSLASALDRAGVGGVVPAEVGPRVQPGECGRDKRFRPRR